MAKRRCAIFPSSWAWSCIAALAAIVSTNASAKPREPRPAIDLAAATLPDALAELSREAAVSIGTEGSLPHLRTPRLHGRMSVGEALARLLAGSGYAARRVGPTAWRIERAPAPVFARGPSAPPPPVADTTPIVVTAAKRRQALGDLPMALSVVRLDKADTHAAMGTSWLSDEVEGLALTNLGPGRNRMFLRGVADSAFNGDSQSTVAVVLDDARLTYTAPDPDIRLIDVERIELLKGPQGSLYGTGALGGIYHIVTHRADLDETSLTASLGGQAVADGNIGVEGAAVANLPVLPGHVALRLVGYSAREPGWVDTGERPNANVSHVFGLRGRLGLDAGGWRIDLTGFGQWLNSRDSQYVYHPGARDRPAQFAEPHDNDMRHLSVRLARRAGAVDMVLTSGLSWHEVDDMLDATEGAEALGLANPERLADERYFRVWDSEARINGSTGGIEWLAGLSHLATRQNRTRTLLTPASSLLIDIERRAASESAVFGEMTVPLADHLKLSLGGRLFHSVIRQSQARAVEVERDERRRDGLTPSATLAWSPNPGRLLFLRYGSAFRQGAIGSDGTGGSTALKDDELATIEAGWREQLGGGGQLGAGAYLSWWENLQSGVLQPDGLIGTQTAGNGRMIGLELSLQQPFAGGWRLRTGAAVTRALLVRNSLGFALNDRRLPVVPAFTLRAVLAHDFRLGRTPVSIEAGLRYLGHAHLSFDPALDRKMGNLIESRLEARAELLGCRFGLEIDNALNRGGDSFAFGNSLRFPSSPQFTPQRPLRVSWNVTKEF